MHDVFISYASPDKLTADAICHGLEAAGIRTWIAPRDVLPGRPYGAAIVEALKSCSVLVLVYSKHANASGMVLRELERAASLSKPLLPVRVDDVTPSDELQFFIGREHWLDALTPPVQAHVERLVQAVRQLTGHPAPPPASPTPHPPGSPAPSPPPAPPLTPTPILADNVFSAVSSAISSAVQSLKPPSPPPPLRPKPTSSPTAPPPIPKSRKKSAPPTLPTDLNPPPLPRSDNPSSTQPPTPPPSALPPPTSE